MPLKNSTLFWTKGFFLYELVSIYAKYSIHYIQNSQLSNTQTEHDFTDALKQPQSLLAVTYNKKVYPLLKSFHRWLLTLKYIKKTQNNKQQSKAEVKPCRFSGEWVHTSFSQIILNKGFAQKIWCSLKYMYTQNENPHSGVKILFLLLCKEALTLT